MSTTRSTRSGGDGHRHGDDGTGLIGSVFGVTVFLLFVLFAAQVTLALHARTAVGAAAYDAVRIASGADGSVAEAESTARQVLGAAGARTTFEWSEDGADVVLRVRMPLTSLLPEVVRRPLGLDDVDRTVRLRRERLAPGQRP